MRQGTQVRKVQPPRLLLQRQHLQATGRAQRLVIGKMSEAIDVHKAIHGLPAVTQLLQGADTQAAEGQHTPWTQYATGLAQHRGEVATPLHGQAGEDQLAAIVTQRQLLGIPGDETASPALRSGMTQHAFGQVQGHTLGLRITRGQATGEMSGTAAQVQPTRRPVCWQVFQELRTHRALQSRHAVVARCGPGKGLGHPALVRQHTFSHRLPHE